ncbi:MAG: hypothetical protein WCK55_00410 [Verrucomicrobiota bacterium]|jgi:hypothetical protein
MKEQQQQMTMPIFLSMTDGMFPDLSGSSLHINGLPGGSQPPSSNV